jgi:hypothetical protein
MNNALFPLYQLGIFFEVGVFNPDIGDSSGFS